MLNASNFDFRLDSCCNLGDAYGRPVGVAVDSSGAILVADDVGDVIWRVSALSTLAAVSK